jgi:hypothetical protein
MNFWAEKTLCCIIVRVAHSFGSDSTATRHKSAMAREVARPRDPDGRANTNIE